MNWASALLWGFIATVVQSTIEAAGRGMGITRMNLPFMLGTMVNRNRDRAAIYGFLVHMINGWALAFIYALIFETLTDPTWWQGVIVGAVHALFVLTVIMPLLPHMHPRMATDHHGPEPTPMLEPPGFLALNYGRMSTIVTFIAHVAYGGLLGWMYKPLT